LPRTWPASLTRCAYAIWASGKVCATGSAKRPDSISSPIGERVDRAASVPATEGHPVLAGATEVGDRHDVLAAACELDELGQDAAPGDVERGVDAAGRERANPPGEALAGATGSASERR